MAVLASGRAARTTFHLMEDLNEYSLLTVSPETGRTHQIRVHLAWVGVPVVGDRVYGRRCNRLGLQRQFLHAWRLSFQRPGGRGRLDLVSPLPPDLRQVLRDLGSQHPG
jgi:23S rRNA pseudouridine1911/1915/1917 synthase